jgi:hypothetical protein
MSQRLDASRKEARELRQKLADVHTAHNQIPAVFLSYLAALADEATNPSRVSESLGCSVTGTGDPRTPRASRPAAAELRRLQAWMTREGTRGLGHADRAETEDGMVGRLEQIVYGKDRRWTPSAASTNTGARMAG